MIPVGRLEVILQTLHIITRADTQQLGLLFLKDKKQKQILRQGSYKRGKMLFLALLQKLYTFAFYMIFAGNREICRYWIHWEGALIIYFTGKQQGAAKLYFFFSNPSYGGFQTQNL